MPERQWRFVVCYHLCFFVEFVPVRVPCLLDIFSGGTRNRITRRPISCQHREDNRAQNTPLTLAMPQKREDAQSGMELNIADTKTPSRGRLISKILSLIEHFGCGLIGFCS